MENCNTTSSVSCTGDTGVLTLIFVVLKLCNVIDWSWWWVLCPIWISFTLLFLFVIILGIISIFAIWMNTRG